MPRDGEAILASEGIVTMMLRRAPNGEWRNKFTLLGVLVAGVSVWLSTGCVVVPIAQSGKQLHDQRKVDARELIKRHATRADVIQKFGPPSRQFDDLQVLAYLWRAHEWDVFWLGGGAGGADAGTLEVTTDHLFLLAFDSSDRLLRWKIEDPYTSKTPWQRARLWCLSSGLPVPPLPPKGATALAAPPNQGLLVIYWRRGGRFQNPPTDNLSFVTLTMDQQPASELEKGFYTTVLLVPGTHLLELRDVPARIPFGGPAERKTFAHEFEIAAGEVAFVELVGRSKDQGFKAVSASQSAADLARLNYCR